ncbi:MAG: Maf family protein [Pseudobdellovibrio sp.]
MNFILASQSSYRRQLIEKLGIPFTIQGPGISEAALKSELHHLTPEQLAEELSLQKGLSVFNSRADRKEILVLSGDQLVECGSEILGKPGSFEKAFEQLKKLTGKTHRLVTAVTLISAEKTVKHTEITTIKMRRLSDDEIKGYLQRDLPFDCAGSYKIEDHGIALVDSVQTNDFTSIQGIPLIWLGHQLKEHHYEFFKS